MRGRALLEQVKREAVERRFCIPVEAPEGIYQLYPVVTDQARLDAGEVQLLTEWRNTNLRAFLTEFQATPERTSRWLSEVVGPSPTKILFMLEDSAGLKLAYLGLAFMEWERAYGEADAIVRGRPLPRGTMRAALQTLLRWARTELELTTLEVRVLEDNPAVEFYRRCGFREHHREGLVSAPTADGVSWSSAHTAQAPARFLVHMTYEG